MTSASSVPLCLENWASPLKKATWASQRTVGSENLQFISAPPLIFFGVIHRGLRKSHSQTFESLSLPNASIGGSTGLTTNETVTRALMKTFGGDNFGINSHKCFLILRPVLRGDSFDGSESAAKVRPETIPP